MMLSICCITYNQEEFIANAIEGFLIQKTNFDFEIVISDDCSTDRTMEICKQYANKNPLKFKLLSGDKNIGMIPNFIKALNACRSKYVAICEGDDYWTNPDKLQKQVDFLEAHPTYSICFHGVNVLENGIESTGECNPSTTEENYSIFDIAEKSFIYTHSVVFKNGLIKQFPSWFNNSPVGDYVLHLLNAKHGLLKYFPEVMAIYRKHNGGIWSKKRHDDLIIKWLWLLEHLITEDFEPAIIEKFRIQKTRLLNEYLDWLLSENKYELIQEAIKKYCDKNEFGSAGFISNLLINKIKSLENQLQSLQTTKSFKLVKKLSNLKNKFS